MTRRTYVVSGHCYQEKLARRHCVAGMDARLELEMQEQVGPGSIVVKAYFRFRQRWETIGRIADAHVDNLVQSIAVQGVLPVTISRVMPRQDGYPEITIELKPEVAPLGAVPNLAGALHPCNR